MTQPPRLTPMQAIGTLVALAILGISLILKFFF